MKKLKQHRCLSAVDKELKKHNTRLAGDLFHPDRVFVATERINNYRDGKRAKQVVASFCPFCGKKLDVDKGINFAEPKP